MPAFPPIRVQPPREPAFKRSRFHLPKGTIYCQNCNRPAYGLIQYDANNLALCADCQTLKQREIAGDKNARTTQASETHPETGVF